jgi:pimeloyl-ACP methyl ester carboxylesterase
MRIVKRILQVIGIIIGIIILYLSIITFVPGFKLPEQHLEKEKQLIKQVDTKPSWSRKDVSFKVKGTSISAWLFLPENLSAPVPCIIMGHGFGGTKDMGLELYAVRYQEAGFAVLVFDYRHFGKSDGEPRQLIWIPYQLEDWSAAIKYARSLKEIDPGKIALWGTSMSGGHVIVTAAKDNRIACVVAQCPGLDGHASGEMFLKRVGIGYAFRMLMHGQRDYFRSWFGLSPHKIPIVGKPGNIACLTTPDAYNGFRKNAPDNFINEVCARILLRGDKYRPVKQAKDVRCPVLLQICEHDSIIPKSAAEETEKQLGKYADAIYYPIGHFDIYIGDNFEKAVSDQLGFLRKNL